ncbi:hypothetical protein [Jannaschia sp. LMIT008]|uniref:hypothetical protein n=1 Tax=Jannaschia maritima TaxID=3032585 RepID=UPI002810CFCA|nr:hypothetical protein [Jannaschia sp. LMIT008]
MRLAKMIEATTEHLKVYLYAGTLVAVGVDVAANTGGSMGGGMGSTLGRLPMDMADPVWLGPVTLGLQMVGALLLVLGVALYAANIWVGFAALRALRFRFVDRGLMLKACGWSMAFVYVIGSLLIGVAVNAVYLSLVG